MEHLSILPERSSKHYVQGDVTLFRLGNKQMRKYPTSRIFPSTVEERDDVLNAESLQYLHEMKTNLNNQTPLFASSCYEAQQLYVLKSSCYEAQQLYVVKSSGNV
jgi:hypothetical protein